MPRSGAGPLELAYYTVADAAFFPGAVALLNSLRLIGEDAPFFVVDCGLTNRQRQALSGHATLIPAAEHLHPMLQKATGPLARPAEVMVVLDADIIVTRSLAPLVEEAGRGRIVAFENDHDRFFPEWEALGLGAPRRERYVCSAQLFIPSGLAGRLLDPFVELQRSLDLSRTLLGAADRSSPFFFPDQDILNAVLSTTFGTSEVTRIATSLAPMAPYSGIHLTDAVRLECEYADGVRPYLLHNILAKPWLAAYPGTVYSRLFTRVVTGPDVELRLGAPDVPLRLRNSLLAGLERCRVSIQSRLRLRLFGQFGIRTSWRRLRAR
jgi:hypothetical protein